VAAVALGLAGVLWQRQRAERHLDEFIRAVDEIFPEVIETELSREPGRQEEQRQRLEKALPLFKRLAAKRPSDPAMRAKVADAQLQVGIITSKIGSTTDALADCHLAGELFEELVRGHPTPAYQSGLALTYHTLGVLHHKVGERQNPLGWLTRARELREQLVRDHSDEPLYRHQLARTCVALGAQHREVGRREEARRWCEKAHELLGPLVKEDAASAKSRDDLAEVCQCLGELEYEVGRDDEALGWYEKALRRRELLARDNPGDAAFAFDFGQSYQRLGLLQQKKGQFQEAFASFSTARESYEKLHRDNPRVSDYRSALASSYKDLGDLLSETARRTEALPWYEKARNLFQALVAADPHSTLHQRDLAAAHNDLATLERECGRPKEALRYYEEARKLQESLLKVDPDATRLAADLARTCRDMGVLQRQGARLREWLASYERAGSLLRQLVEVDAEAVEFRSSLGNICTNIGIVHTDTNKRDLALRFHGEAQTIHAGLVKSHPDNREFRRQLAQSYSNIGFLYLRDGASRRDGSYLQARDAATRAARLYEGLAAHPAVARYRSELANTYNNLGWVYRLIKRPREERHWFDRERGLREKLVADEPGVRLLRVALTDTCKLLMLVEFDADQPDKALLVIKRMEQLWEHEPGDGYSRQVLAESYSYLGQQYLKAGRHPEALRNCEKGRSLWEALVKAHPKERAYQRQLGVSCCFLGNVHRDKGDLEQALSSYEHASRQFQGLHGATGEELCLVAVEVAVALGGGGKEKRPLASPEAARWADKAMEILKLAVAQGFTNVRAIREAPALAPLRSRGDFRAVLADLEVKAKKSPDHKPGG
jgi:tetratricopeptide (TPR) repeat protein